MKALVQVLSGAEVEQVHQASLEVLESVGVEFHQQEVLALFQACGAEVKETRVRIGNRLVAKALASVPPRFWLEARNPEHSVLIGGADPVYAPPAGCVYVQNVGEEKRTAKREDYINLIKLIHSSRFYNLNGGGLAFPKLPLEISELEKFAWMMLAGHWYSDKFQMGFTLGSDIAQTCLDLRNIVFRGKAGCHVLGVVNPDSPLTYSEKMLEGLLLFARAGQPVIIAPCSMAMATSPATLAGTLSLNNAEVLAGIVLTQLINPGTPVIFGNTSTIADMQTMGIAIGAPELSLLAGAVVQMANYYELPSRVGGSLTDAKTPDFQAGMESMLSMLTSVSTGASLILHSGGILDSFLTLSFEKLLIDEDLGGMAHRFRRGIEVNKNSLAVPVIQEVGPGGNFLATDHTMEHFRREFFRPRLSDRKVYQAEADYKTYFLELAKTAWKRRLDTFARPGSPLDTEKDLLQYYQEKFGKDPYLP